MINIHIVIEKDDNANHLRIMGNALLKIADDTPVIERVEPDRNPEPEHEHKDVLPADLGGSESNEVELDKNGIPWDERIHSSSHKQNQDNTWKLVKKPKDYTVEAWKIFVAKVLLELSGDTSTAESENPNPEDLSDAFGGDDAQLAPAPDTITTFTPFMAYINDDNCPVEMCDVLEICNMYGITGLMQLSKDPSMIPNIYADIQAKING